MLLLDRADCAWPASPSLLEHLFPNDSSGFKSSSLLVATLLFISHIARISGVGCQPIFVFKISSERTCPSHPSCADPVFPLPSVACMRSFRSLQQLCSISPGGLPNSVRWGTSCRVLWVCAHCSKPPRLLCIDASASSPHSGDKPRKAPGMRAQKLTEQRKLPRIQVPIILFLSQQPWPQPSRLVSAGLDS